VLKRSLLVVGLITSCASFSLAQEVSVSLKNEADHVHFVQGGFFTYASTGTIWGVLTDYDSIPRFSSLMHSSHVTERHPDYLLVEQKADADFLMFSRHVDLLLKIHEKPPDTITFEDVAGKDFYFYAGSWHIEDVPGGHRVLYSLRMKQKASSAPDFIVRKVFKRDAKRFLEEVAEEIVHRTSPS